MLKLAQISAVLGLAALLLLPTTFPLTGRADEREERERAEQRERAEREERERAEQQERAEQRERAEREERERAEQRETIRRRNLEEFERSREAIARGIREHERLLESDEIGPDQRAALRQHLQRQRQMLETMSRRIEKLAHDAQARGPAHEAEHHERDAHHEPRREHLEHAEHVERELAEHRAAVMRRIEHIRLAAEQLEQAGLPDQAHALHRQAEELHGQLHPPAPHPEALHGLVQDLRHEVHALREQVHELRERIARLERNNDHDHDHDHDHDYDDPDDDDDDDDD